MFRPVFPTTPRGVPVMRNAELEDCAVELVREFCPEKLSEPAPFDVQRFVRERLGYRICCRRLSGDGSVLGETFFRDALLCHYREDGTPAPPMRIPAGTVVLESRLLSCPETARFTLAHEAAHILLHRGYYCTLADRVEDQVEDLTAAGELRMSDGDWLEYQADRFAGALLMNREAAHFYWERLRDYLDGVFSDDARSANAYAADAFSGRFWVSRAAARVRLRQLDLVRDDPAREGVRRTVPTLN